MNGKEIIVEHLELILIFGAIAAIANGIAYAKGFFHFPNYKSDRVHLTFRHVAIIFLIYLILMLLVIPILARIILWLSGDVLPPESSGRMAMLAGVQLFGVALTAALIWLYSRSQKQIAMKNIWKDPSHPNNHGIFYDFGIGMMTWILSFPLVAVVGQLADLIIFFLFGVVTYEQVAVRYLRSTLEIPSLLTIALLMILIVAPFLEEFLFRGCLQTWFKEKMGAKSAILLSALIFALFHLAPSQGAGNISLAASLLVFGWFLGFIYERQGSLFASIGLHMSFNIISVCRLLFVSES